MFGSIHIRRSFLSLGIAATASLVFTVSALGQDGNGEQPPALVLGSSVQISADRPTAPHVESFLAIDPKDPNRMLATSISFENGQLTSVAYSSRDGGRSWQRSQSFGANVPHFSGGDPAIYFDATGAALFTTIENPPDGFSRVWRSADDGAHWNSFVNVPCGHYDREYMAIDSTSGPYAGRIYYAGTISVSTVTASNERSSIPALGVTYSIDNGVTFGPTKVVDATLSNGHSGGFGTLGDLLITSRGALIIPFSATVDLKGPARAFWVFVSEDGGRRFSARQGLPFERGPMSFRRRVSGSNLRAAIDHSAGPFCDRIYVAWVDYANSRYDIKVAHSDDLGLSWSRPVSVNDNMNQNDPSNLAIAVNGAGVVALIWNDRREDSTDMCFRVYASASLDGGDTFLPNVPFSPHPTCFNTRGNWSGSVFVNSTSDGFEMSSVPTRFFGGGETQGLAASPDGRFHAAWNKDGSGVMQLWYTTFTVQGNLRGTDVTRRLGRGEEFCGQTTAPGSNSPETADARNVTQYVDFEVSAPVVDFDTKSVSVNVQVKNKSLCHIAGPLTLVLDKIETDFGGLAIANADNHLRDKGAAWKLVADPKGLAPGEETKQQFIRWQFDGQVPEPKHVLNQFVVHFKMLDGTVH